jgi:BirA family biotin operon repressor/biotin-[acetyl-CoA-carboxylase] ligase
MKRPKHEGENALEPLSSKARILAMLRQDTGRFFSGGLMAGELGISRVAVWKAIRALKDSGYPIQAAKRGYMLPDAKGDFLYPWEFGEKEADVHYFESTGSTMDRARELALKNAPQGTVVCAETQSSGRGREGRTWNSGRGGLFVTLIEKPGAGLAGYGLFGLRGSLAAARTLSRLLNTAVWPRWPNDLYAKGKKLGGVLCEFQSEGDRLLWLTLGLGVNVYNKARTNDAINCAELTQKPPPRRDILSRFLLELEKIPLDARLVPSWNRETFGIGFPVAVVPGDHHDGKKRGPGTFTGRFEGIDSLGRALVRSPQGVGRYFPGQVSLIYRG